MARLAVTLIDVGWGDSILIQSDEGAGNRRFALVDCNDYETERSSLIFVKRFFEREQIDYEASRPNFEWVLLTHGHADHARGMKRMLSLFGTVDFGDVSVRVLWPEYDQVDASNENNNSVVLALTLGQVSFVLTGDAEAENWATIAGRLPPSIRVFQVPHHGGRNGTFGPGDITPWLDLLPAATQLALSSHIRPHGHPHPDVVNLLGTRNFVAFRTDLQSHLTFSTDGTNVDVQYSHV